MRLTPVGLGAVAGGLALLACGLVLGFPACTAVGTVCLVLVLAAFIQVAGRPRLTVGRLASPPEVPRQSPAEVTLTLSAPAGRQRATRLVERVGGQDRVAHVRRIDAEGTTITYPVDTSRRGMVVCGPLIARRADPFGLVVASTRFGGTCSVRIRPRVHHLRMLPSGRQRDLEGPTRERSEGTASFHQIREYAVGDDLRRIHWPTTARTGTLMVRQMVDTTRPELVVVVDNRRMAMTPADFEEAVDIAASLLRAAETEGFPTTLQFADGSGDGAAALGPGGHAGDGRGGRGHATPALPHLDRLTEVAQHTTDSLLQLGQQLHARGRSLVVITGEPSGPDLVAIGRLAAGFSPAYLVSVAGTRTQPLVAPPAMRAIACATATDFVSAWSAR